MNKILLASDKIDDTNLDQNIVYQMIPKNSLFDVNTLKIDILNDTELTITYNILEESKLNVEINIEPNVKANIIELKEGAKSKIKYQYNLNKNSLLNVYKLYDVDGVKEFVRIDLNDENATINYIVKTVSKNIEKYDLTIYHNHSNTNSTIINNGVNINDGSLVFNVSSFVQKGHINCNVIQNSRIINLTDNICQICPNLFIDEYDVNASHSALIGTFKDDEKFYLMSRGITAKESNYLLIKGFLLNNMDFLKQNIDQICEKYWR